MFNSRRVACEAAVEQKVRNRTVRRAMKKHGFKWANARRKGQLSMEDEKARLRWARSKVSDGVTQEFWNHEVSQAYYWHKYYCYHHQYVLLFRKYHFFRCYCFSSFLEAQSFPGFL